MAVHPPGQMMSQFQKHFNSEIEEVVDSRTITFAQLAEHFNLPINEVAKKLGVCLTVLKKVCRKQGIPRWPYRKLKSLDKSIEGLRNSAMNCPAEAHSIFLEIENLEKQKLDIRENPSILVKDAQTPESSDRSPPPPHLGASHSQPPLHQNLTRSEGRVPACRSEPPPKKKKEKRRQMTKISNNVADGALFPPSSFCSPPPKPDEELETRKAPSSFAFDQFHPSGGRSPTDFFLHDNASRISPSSDPFEPSPISPESPGSPSPSPTTNHTNHVATAGWLPSNTPQNTSKEGTHSSSPHPTNHPHTELKNNINSSSSRSSVLPLTPNSGRTRKRDEIEGNNSPFASPFSSFASPQLFGVSQSGSFHLGSSSSQQQLGSPYHCFSHQLPQLEQKLRETCLNSPTTNPISNPTTTTAGSVSHFSAAPGAGNPPITNPALLPSFQELVSFQPLPTQPLPTQNFYRNQLGSVTPDIPRPSKRMRDNQSDQVANFHFPSLENFTPH